MEADIRVNNAEYITKPQASCDCIYQFILVVYILVMYKTYDNSECKCLK